MVVALELYLDAPDMALPRLNNFSFWILPFAFTLLLATLGIMIGLFTVTGFINRMGATLLDLGSWNILAMIAMAYIFGWLVGAGLPPTAIATAASMPPTSTWFCRSSLKTARTRFAPCSTPCCRCAG